MCQYVIRFFFSPDCNFLWGGCNETILKYGYPIQPEALPISAHLSVKLNRLMKEYHTYFDWDYPPDPSPWSKEQKNDFIERVDVAYSELVQGLGAIFFVVKEYRPLE